MPLSIVADPVTIAARLASVLVRQSIAPVRALMPISNAGPRSGVIRLPVPITNSPFQYAGLVREADLAVPVYSLTSCDQMALPVLVSMAQSLPPQSGK